MTSEPAPDERPPYAGAHAAGGPDGGQDQPPTAASTSLSTSNSFFSWLRSLGIVRAPDRWIGGVAGGLAERTGLDVVLVRGLLVILAVFGGIGVLLYGLAWALLPEPDGRIHAEQAGRGIWTGGMTGAAILSVMGLWRPNLPFFGDSGAAPFLWTIAWVGGVVFIIYWAVNRSRNREALAGGYSASYPAASYPAGYPGGGFRQAGFQQAGGAYSATIPAGSPQAGLPQAGSPQAGAMHSGGVPTGTMPTRTAPTRTMPMGPLPTDTRPYQATPPRTPVPRPSGSQTALSFGAALTVVGIILALDYTNVLDLGDTVGAVALAAGAMTLGLGVVILGILGRTSGLMGLVGFLTALAAVVLPLELPQGRWIVAASGSTAATEITTAERGYTAVAAESTIDLTELGTLRNDVVVPIHSVAADVDIAVPAGVPVEVRSRLILGAVQLTDGTDSFASEGVWQPETLELGEQSSGPTIIIEVSGAVSDVSVTAQETGNTP
ncbi:PspC domain-containing protein [Arthrobacter sp. Br18]|uniref:PspC domain-containing protein n=1 Tax=Arthrobacter sp. Br18 TaxID=1312954 RepID=UPI0004AF8626|nr:PspC domain-containing protein [Arthrobacter sp. Br18]